MAHLTGNHMQFWDTFTSYSKDPARDGQRGAWLYEQPLWRHLAGQATHRLWMAIPGQWHLAHGEGWRLDLELWATDTMPRRGRVDLHEARLGSERLAELRAAARRRRATMPPYPDTPEERAAQREDHEVMMEMQSRSHSWSCDAPTCTHGE